MDGFCGSMTAAAVILLLFIHFKYLTAQLLEDTELKYDINLFHEDSESNVIYSIALDLQNPQYILYATNHSLKTTDGFVEEIIVGGSELGYRESVRDHALFYFKESSLILQLSNQTVIIADTGNRCIRSVDRQTNATARWAGQCDSTSDEGVQLGHRLTQFKMTRPQCLSLGRSVDEILVCDTIISNKLLSVDLVSGEISEVLTYKSASYAKLIFIALSAFYPHDFLGLFSGAKFDVGYHVPPEPVKVRYAHRDAIKFGMELEDWNLLVEVENLQEEHTVRVWNTINGTQSSPIGSLCYDTNQCELEDAFIHDRLVFTATSSSIKTINGLMGYVTPEHWTTSGVHESGETRHQETISDTTSTQSTPTPTTSKPPATSEPPATSQPPVDPQLSTEEDVSVSSFPPVPQSTVSMLTSHQANETNQLFSTDHCSFLCKRNGCSYFQLKADNSSIINTLC